jgi:hypothetical protein
VADRRNYFFGQQVQEGELDAGFDGLERAIWNLAADLGLVGVSSGGVVTQHAPTPDLTVDVTSVRAYDQQGRRIEFPSTQTPSLATDSNSVSTAVVNGGNSKIVSLFVRFKRDQSDPRTDDNAVPLNFVQDEGFEFVIVQGAEAVTPTPPALLSDGILLADVTRTFGQTQILNADISTSRRQDMFVGAVGATGFRAGTPEEALLDVLTELNNHITGVANLHPATAISYAGSANWADGTQVTAPTMEAAVDEVVSDLANASTGISGANKIGAPGVAGSPDSITAPGSAQGAISQLLTLVNARARKAAAETISAIFTHTARIILAGASAWLEFAEDASAAEHVRFTPYAGTGANNGKTMVFFGQPGQAQSGANPNTHGGGFKFRLGERGAGGSGAAGRPGGFSVEPQGTSSPRRYWYPSHGATSVVASTSNAVVQTIDRAHELEGIGSLIEIECTFLVAETTGGTPTVGTWTIKRTAQFASGAWTFLGGITTVASQHNFAGGAPAPGIAISGTELRPVFTAPSVDVTVAVFTTITVRN